ELDDDPEVVPAIPGAGAPGIHGDRGRAGDEEVDFALALGPEAHAFEHRDVVRTVTEAVVVERDPDLGAPVGEPTPPRADCIITAMRILIGPLDGIGRLGELLAEGSVVGDEPSARAPFDAGRGFVFE